jgi:hypothetical protein
MEEPKDKVKSNRRKIASVVIAITLIAFTLSSVLLSTWFISTDSPVLVEKEVTVGIEYPTQKDQGKSGLAELDFGEEKIEEIVLDEPQHDFDNHTHNKITLTPMTILDMVYFLNEHQEISDQDSGVLMSYAVAKETGMNADEEVDHLAYHIMEKIE